MKYKVMDRETHNGTFGEFDTLDEAKRFIADQEADDIREGNFEPDWYDIVVEETEQIVLDRKYIFQKVYEFYSRPDVKRSFKNEKQFQRTVHNNARFICRVLEIKE